MALLAAMFSSLVFGVADFAGGFATRRTPVRLVVLFSQLVGLATVVLAALAIDASGLGPADLAWGASAGLAGMAALLIFYEGLAKGIMSIVSPLAALASFGLPVVFGLAVGERPSILAAIGVVLAIPAVVLISGQADHQASSALWRGGAVYGLAAGLGFGTFFILISRAGATSGMWPLVAARTTSVLAMALILIAARRLAVPPRTQWPVIAVAGFADILANVFFVVAARDSLLILASVIVSLYPASTLILARFVLGERTSLTQRWGLALGVLTVVTIAAG